MTQCPYLQKQLRRSGGYDDAGNKLHELTKRSFGVWIIVGCVSHAMVGGETETSGAFHHVWTKPLASSPPEAE